METPKYFFQYRDDAQKLFLREYVYALGTFHYNWHDEIELLVGGIPREYDDLEGWSEFDDSMYFISEETEVSVRAEAYRYGEGESMRASPEEIDDLMQRIKDDSGFLNRCCSNLESVNFTFVWSPEELFDMPFGQMLM